MTHLFWKTQAFFVDVLYGRPLLSSSLNACFMLTLRLQMRIVINLVQ